MKPEDRFKILVVDDSPQDARVMLDSLSQTYDAFFAIGGPEALRIAEREYPDLTLLDIYMGGMDGFEVCRRLKQIPEIADNPVIFITGYGDVWTAVQAMKNGAFDFLEKPLDLDLLELRIRRVLTMRKLDREVRLLRERLRERIDIEGNATTLDRVIRRQFRAVEGDPFDPIIVAGPRTALIHGKPSDRKIKPGDLVLLDFGCIHKGYCSDMTRTVAVGKASKRKQKMYDAVLQAQTHCDQSIGPAQHQSGNQNVHFEYPRRKGRRRGGATIVDCNTRALGVQACHNSRADTPG